MHVLPGVVVVEALASLQLVKCAYTTWLGGSRGTRQLVKCAYTTWGGGSRGTSLLACTTWLEALASLISLGECYNYLSLEFIDLYCFHRNKFSFCKKTSYI